ncbi:MAG: response regulator [Candidatus Omnitrophota bacterium]
MKKIIIIDDDKAFLEEFSGSLTLEGYQAICLTDEEALLDEIQREKPDLIFLDLKMKKVNAFKFAGELTKEKKTSAIPLVAVTGVYVEDEFNMIMKSCGIMSCLTKPVDIVSAVKTIEALCLKK